ncbi:hypothetical protein ACLB2K_069795 [Fragaria x ananassa]
MVGSGEKGKRTRCGITELPNCVMVNTILASPPQWKTLSHPILTRRNLEFNYLNVLGRNYRGTVFDVTARARAFVRRVSKYLQQYQGNKVESLKIDCYHGIKVKSKTEVRLDEWIRFAIMKSVEELHVRPGWCSMSHRDLIIFPLLSLVGSTSNLKHLLLERCILRQQSPTDFDGFKLLTTLRLNEVALDNCLMANLLSVCLLLESLTLDRCCRMYDKSFLDFDLPVVCDRLTDLKVLQGMYMYGTNVNISALNLTSLEFIAYVGCSCSFLQSPQLARIYFSGTGLCRGNELVKISEALVQFASCPALETLHLRIPAETPRISSFQTYGNLKQLNLDLDLDRKRRKDNDDVDVNCVLDLLKAAPLLEEFTITTQNGQDLSKTNPRETRNRSGFTNDHLRMVKMQGFTGNWYERELAICILEISVVEGKLKGVRTDAQIILL